MNARKRGGRPRSSDAPRPAPPSARRAAALTFARIPAAPPLLLWALALGFLLRAAASLTHVHGVWGLDTLRPWPLAPALAVLALGALGFVPPLARLIERGLDEVGALWERGGLAVDLAVAAGVALALYRLRDPVMFTGDFSTRVSQLVLHSPVAKVFPQVSPLDRWINIELTRWLVGAHLLEVTPALHLVGALVGFGFVLTTLAFARAAGAARAMLPAAAAVLLGGAYLIHFSGYDKFGPLLLGIALASLGAVRLARTGRGALVLGFGVAVCVLSHRSGFALLPAAALALVQAWRRAEDARARAGIGAAAAIMLAPAIAILPRAIHVLQSVDRLQNLPGAPQGGGPPLYGIPDLALRATDALNLLFLIAPLWLAGVAAAWLARSAPPPREARRFPLAPAASLALGAELLLLLVVRGAQGVARDWDMHVAPALLVTLVTAYLLIVVWQGIGAARGIAPAFTTAIACAIALWGIHVSEPIGIARVGELLANRAAWSDAAWARAHDFMGVRALQQARPVVAIAELEAAISAAPNPRFYFELGIAHRMLGHAAEARTNIEKAHTLDPMLSDPWVGFALLAVDARDFAGAVIDCDSALAISPHRGDAKQIRASALNAMQLMAQPSSPFH
jgi:tetratricopeptide (TPR) repeat protein